jgi:hypothetical protein
VANKVWKHEIIDGQRKGGREGGMKGRNGEGRMIEREK